MLGTEGAEKALDVYSRGVRSVLVDHPDEGDLLVTHIMNDLNVPRLVRHRYLLHDVDYVPLDGYGCVRQMYSVELLHDLLEGL